MQNATTAHFQQAGFPSPLVRAVAKIKITIKIQNFKFWIEILHFNR